MTEITLTEQIRLILSNPANAPMTLEEIISEEIKSFRASEQYRHMVEAEKYYRNRSDVQRKTTEMANRSNTKIEHPILRYLITQKVNYLLAKPWSVDTGSDAYGEALNQLFDADFRRKIKSLGKGAIQAGIAWLQPYFDHGKLAFMRIPSTELIPLWADAEHSRLDSFIRFYQQEVYVGRNKRTVTHAEFWHQGGVQYFIADDVEGGHFRVNPEHGNQENNWVVPHFGIGDKVYNWAEVPIVWLKYNEEELPLQYFLKELIDDVNWQTSITADVLRDVAKFIYVLRGYGGTELDQFVQDLREALAINVDADGGVDKLQAEVDIGAVMAFLEKNRRDLFQFAAAVNTKDPDLGNASGTAINFRYMDLDADCAALADELQGTFRRLKLFIDVYLQLTNQGKFTAETFDIIFNMDLPVNETDVIGNVRASTGILSQRTLLQNHPWVKDVEEEMGWLKQDQAETVDEYGQPPLLNGEQDEE